MPETPNTPSHRRLSEEEALDIWGRLLDAQADVLFWGRMLRSRSAVDKWMTVILLSSLLGPVLNLHYFVQHPYKLQVALALTGVLSVIQVVLAFASTADSMVEVHRECSILFNRYDLLWGDLEHMQADEARSEIRDLKRKESEIERLSVKLPTNSRIYKQCFREVCRIHGLESPI